MAQQAIVKTRIGNKYEGTFKSFDQVEGTIVLEDVRLCIHSISTYTDGKRSIDSLPIISTVNSKVFSFIVFKLKSLTYLEIDGVQIKTNMFMGRSDEEHKTRINMENGCINKAKQVEEGVLFGVQDFEEKLKLCKRDGEFDGRCYELEGISDGVMGESDSRSIGVDEVSTIAVVTVTDTGINEEMKSGKNEGMRNGRSERMKSDNNERARNGKSKNNAHEKIMDEKDVSFNLSFTDEVLAVMNSSEKKDDSSESRRARDKKDFREKNESFSYKGSIDKEKYASKRNQHTSPRLKYAHSYEIDASNNEHNDESYFTNHSEGKPRARHPKKAVRQEKKRSCEKDAYGLKGNVPKNDFDFANTESIDKIESEVEKSTDNSKKSFFDEF
ncbi:hypothetical protein VCUG_01452 [Vavraia culicis subsp. floridensis]|uniref:Uncharacterized protein n=1 Tax=Vavraia culicis (isolate floridensis) TaxID=948595 RepID=L2GTU7_VAVCU|nr:uncharacterized protein VCUG_01452 [Vavraia culicis subsp. floridensis]ELA47091.1 hypothetical protein VCUG_01452 [Vavraia culicis subsp. floridensis]